MQKRSQNPQRLRGKQRNHLKNGRDREEEIQMLNKEMGFRALSEKSGDCRKAAAELENEIQALQQEFDIRFRTPDAPECTAEGSLGQGFSSRVDPAEGSDATSDNMGDEGLP